MQETVELVNHSKVEFFDQIITIKGKKTYATKQKTLAEHVIMAFRIHEESQKSIKKKCAIEKKPQHKQLFYRNPMFV